MRSGPSRAVNIGTNAKTMLLIRTEFKVSMGPIATASESARLCMPSSAAARATRPNPRILPMRTPATRVSPPRINGLSTARERPRSERRAESWEGKLRETSERIPLPCVSRTGWQGSGALLPPLRGRRSGATRSRQRGLVVREVRNFLHVLRVPDLIVLVHHKDRAALDPQFFDQRAVVRAERAIFVVR